MSLIDFATTARRELQTRNVKWNDLHSQIAVTPSMTLHHVVLDSAGGSIVSVETCEVDNGVPRYRWKQDNQTIYPGKPLAMVKGRDKDNGAFFKSVAALQEVIEKSGSKRKAVEKWSEMLGMISGYGTDRLADMLVAAKKKGRVTAQQYEVLAEGAIVVFSFSDGYFLGNKAFSDLSGVLHDYDKIGDNAIDAFGNPYDSGRTEEGFPAAAMPQGYNFKDQCPYYQNKGVSLLNRNKESKSLSKWGMNYAASPVSPVNREELLAVMRHITSPRQFKKTWAVDDDQSIFVAFPVGAMTEEQQIKLERLAEEEVYGHNVASESERSAIASEKEDVYYEETGKLLNELVKKTPLADTAPPGLLLLSYRLVGDSPIEVLFDERVAIGQYSEWVRNWVRDLTVPGNFPVSNLIPQKDGGRGGVLWRHRPAVPLPYEIVRALRDGYRPPEPGNKYPKVVGLGSPFKSSHIHSLFTGRMSYSDMMRMLCWSYNESKSGMIFYASISALKGFSGYGVGLNRGLLTLIAVQNLLCRRLGRGSLMEGLAYTVGRVVGLLDIMHIENHRSLLLKGGGDGEVPPNRALGLVSLRSVAVSPGATLTSLSNRLVHSIKWAMNMSENGYAGLEDDTQINAKVQKLAETEFPRTSVEVIRKIVLSRRKAARAFRSHARIYRDVKDQLDRPFDMVDRVKLQAGYLNPWNGLTSDKDTAPPPAEEVVSK